MRVALVARGDHGEPVSEAARILDRFGDLAAGLRDSGHTVEPVLYDENIADQVRVTLVDVDLVLVWINPIDAGRDRSQLDQLLRDVASSGVWVSAHPDVVLSLGTKRVLYDTRNLGWGADTRLYETIEELISGLETTLATGPRVLKQHRGSSGHGVWSVELDGSQLRVRHAQRGSQDETMSFDDFVARCEPFLGGPIIDQPFQTRIAEGMVRCYLVQDQVAGFGHQATNALVPVAAGATPLTPTKRHYHPPTKPEFQKLKEQLEREWIPELLEIFGLSIEQLPLLWDCDFLLGPKDADGADTYVLCEINVSSVSPYPTSVVPAIVKALKR